MKGTLLHTSILVTPSENLINYIQKLNLPNNVPLGISRLHLQQIVDSTNQNQTKLTYCMNSDDKVFINKFKIQSREFNKRSPTSTSNSSNSMYFLNIEDLYWIYNYIQEDNKLKSTSEKLYFHELFSGSKVIFPENEKIHRNDELKKWCERLHIQQQNKEYKKITKNVDCFHKNLPEDTISYHLKQANKQLIAVAQFVFSVAAGFIFGLIGIELMTGKLDFGFRLLLGIICSLVIAAAEFYFLAKKLNEDMEFDKIMKEEFEL